MFPSRLPLTFSLIPSSGSHKGLDQVHTWHDLQGASMSPTLLVTRAYANGLWVPSHLKKKKMTITIVQLLRLMIWTDDGHVLAAGQWACAGQSAYDVASKRVTSLVTCDPDARGPTRGTLLGHPQR